MKCALRSAIYGLAARQVAAHAIFQELWCARMPLSNTPVTNVMSNDIRCNAGTKPVAHKCAVPAGTTVTVEMHQQPGDRSCSNQAIGGAHYGPVTAYLSKVADSSTADGSSDWFKVFEDGWSAASSGGSGDDDNWGTKDLNTCCGKMDVPLPSNLAAGDYLLRAEALALHTAASAGGAQFYMTCYQLTVTAGGAAASVAEANITSNLAVDVAYDTVKFPGAYKSTDPGILINIHQKLSGPYVVPGPAVISGGTTRVAGSACTGCESTCKAGSGPSGTAVAVAAAAPSTSTDSTGSSDGSSNSAGSASGNAACTVQRFGQCGGNGYTGCSNCASGLSCKAVSPPYYSQCA
ncbi:hypothetical protein SEUCBS139899_010033 [Sporothrix eucalyptigena]|uniref:lytic cellulose monooxygenase (C4-dehydrogenating) n=1 Tax=Sporothrix eucalyptigena TaxID=1812306 RepID=A0ABP0CND8_9PEZI